MTTQVEEQCTYCGKYFADLDTHLEVCPDKIVSERERATSVRPSPELVEDPGDIEPGEYFTPPGGFPQKKRWTRQMLESLCDKYAEATPEERQQMKDRGEYYEWQENFMVPAGMSRPDVTWNGVHYRLNMSGPNRIPNVIASTAIDSAMATQAAFNRPGAADAQQAATGQLWQGLGQGFIEDTPEGQS